MIFKIFYARKQKLNLKDKIIKKITKQNITIAIKI